MKKYTLYLVLFYSGLTFAQTDVVLQASAVRTVEVSRRIAEQPAILDTVIPSPMIEYPLLALQYPTEAEMASIDPATIKIVDKLPQLYHTYIKLGVGSEFMPLGEVYFDSKRTRKYMYGAHVKHLSSLGNIPDYARSTFDRTGVQLYGGINERKYKLRGDFHYRNQGLNYYSVKVPTIDSLERETTAQRYQDIGGRASFGSSYRYDTLNIIYNVGLTYNHFSSRKPRIDSLVDWRAKEDNVSFDLHAHHFTGLHTFAVDLGVKYNSYKYGKEFDSLSLYDFGLNQANTILSLRPHFLTYLWDNKFKAKIGMDITANGTGSTEFFLYPNIELKYSLFNDIFIPYFNIGGGMKQTTYKNLTADNEFIKPNVFLANENHPLALSGGIKGTLSKRVSFNLGGSYTRIQNMALFVTDTLNVFNNRFDVIYDTLNQVLFEGSIAYQLNEKLKIDLIGRFYSYEMKNNIYAWNLPTFQSISRVYYNLFEKFYANLDLNFEGGRKALVYAEEDDVLEEDGQLAKDLGLIYDFNLGLEYRYNSRISAFVQFNNIASTRYLRWYNTPVHRFQVMGGVTFRF